MWHIIGVIKPRDDTKATVMGYIETDGTNMCVRNMAQTVQGVKSGRYDTEVVQLSTTGRKITFSGMSDDLLPVYVMKPNGQLESCDGRYSVKALVKQKNNLIGVLIYRYGESHYVKLVGCRTEEEIRKVAYICEYACFNARITKKATSIQIAAKKGRLPEIDYDEWMESKKTGKGQGSIRNKAEANNSNTEIPHIEIPPRSVLAKGAFAYNATLESVHIQQGNSQIPDECFMGCKYIKRVQIEDGVMRIGSKAFKSMGQLTEIAIPQSVKTIGAYAFQGAECLRIVRLGGVRDIEVGAFEDTGVADVTFPTTLVKIGDHAFFGCTYINQVTLPSNVQILGIEVFRRCTGLKQMTFDADVLQIPRGFLQDCSGLERVHIAKGVQEIGEEAFYQSGAEGFVVTFEKGSQLYSIGNEAFMGGKLKQINLPEGLKILQDDVFHSCKDLQKIGLPEGLKSIGRYCFYNTALSEIDIPDSVKQMGVSMLSCCNELSRVKLPATISYIPSGFLSKSSKIAQIDLPKTLQRIGSGAFQFCESLTTITIPHGVTTIEASVFEGCNALQSIKLPDTVFEIGARAFQHCKGLTEVKLPLYLREIPIDMFNGCISLKSICIPQEVSVIGQRAFKGCTLLKQIELPDNIEVIHVDAFEGCSKKLKIICSEDSMTAQRMRFLGFNNIVSKQASK